MSDIPSDIMGMAHWAIMGHAIGTDLGLERKEKLVADVARVILMEREAWIGWRPIETAPLDEMVLVVDVNWPPALQKDIKPPVKVGYKDLCMSSWRIFGASWTPTHWMPLPEPPK